MSQERKENRVESETKIPNKIGKFFARLKLQRKSNPDEWDIKYRYVLDQVKLMKKKQLLQLRKLNSRAIEIAPSESMAEIISVYSALIKGEPIEASLIKSEYNSGFYWWLKPINQKGCYPPYFVLHKNWIVWLKKIFPLANIQLSPFSVYTYCSDGEKIPFTEYFPKYPIIYLDYELSTDKNFWIDVNWYEKYHLKSVRKYASEIHCNIEGLLQFLFLPVDQVDWIHDDPESYSAFLQLEAEIYPEVKERKIVVHSSEWRRESNQRLFEKVKQEFENDPHFIEQTLSALTKWGEFNEFSTITFQRPIDVEKYKQTVKELLNSQITFE